MTPNGHKDRAKETPRRTLPREVCQGALTQMIFDGQANSESRIEMLLDRIAEARQ